MNFVQIGQGAMLVRDVTDTRDRRDVTVHAVDAFESHDLGARGVDAGHQLIKMVNVVMAKDEPFCPGPADSLDHGVVVLRVGKNGAIGKDAPQGSQCRQIADPARCKDQGGFLAVQFGQFGLQGDVLAIRAGNIPRASRSCTREVNGIVHGRQNVGMLTHAKVVVAAPDGHRLRRAIRPMPYCRGKGAGDTLQLDERPIATFKLHLVQQILERFSVVHDRTLATLIGWLRDCFESSASMYGHDPYNARVISIRLAGRLFWQGASCDRHVSMPARNYFLYLGYLMAIPITHGQGVTSGWVRT